MLNTNNILCEGYNWCGWYRLALQKINFLSFCFRSGLRILRSVSGQEKHTLKSGNSSFKKDARCWGNSTSQAASLAGHGYVMYGSIWRPWCTYSTQYQLVTLLKRNARRNIIYFFCGVLNSRTLSSSSIIFFCSCFGVIAQLSIAIIQSHWLQDIFLNPLDQKIALSVLSI